MTEAELEKLAIEITDQCIASSDIDDVYQLALKHLTAVDFAARSDKISVGMSGLTDAKVSELAKLTAKQVYTQGVSAGKIEGWNDAIEAAHKIACETTPYADEILKLKKET